MLERLGNIHVVLVRPKLPENIGAAARAIANMGLGGLVVVSPLRRAPERMRALATEHGRRVLDAMAECASLEEALGAFHFAVGTTARAGARRGSLVSPRQAAREILEWAGVGRVAIVFGPEDNGLTTAELDRCRMSMTIPTTEAASLNLAQAVVVIGYELRATALEAQELGRPSSPAPAPLKELHGLIEHLKEAFAAIDVIDRRNPDHFMRTLKAPLERAGMSSKEVRAWRGVARQVLWLAGQMRREGRDKCSP